MADVRALLAAERQLRRISHPHLTYSKTGVLNCNVCDLNIRSEQLWPGHLKSLNHRKNVQKVSSSSQPARPAKRKIESVEPVDETERNYEVDSRKKPKPASDDAVLSKVDSEPHLDNANVAELMEEERPTPIDVEEEAVAQVQQQQSTTATIAPSKNVDEDEWAAFEREVAPLVNQDHASTTIEAAPVSAAEIAAQQKTNAIQEREHEAEAEKEDESRRIEEEFEVMEEMEDRVKRLRARREALRSQDTAGNPEPVIATATDVELIDEPRNEVDVVANDSSSEEEDDWYG